MLSTNQRQGFSKIGRIFPEHVEQSFLDPDFIFVAVCRISRNRFAKQKFAQLRTNSLNVSAAVLRTFYQSCIESVLTFSLQCWFEGLNVKSKNVLNKVVNVCGKVVGERQKQLSQLYERRVVRKARVIVDNNSHVLAKHYELPSIW